MAYGNDARLALAIYTLLHANRLVSSIGPVIPPGFRQCSCSETLFRVQLVTTAVQLTFISLTDPAEPEFLGTVPWLLDRLLREWAIYGTTDESSRESQTVLERLLGVSLSLQAIETRVADAAGDVTAF